MTRELREVHMEQHEGFGDEEKRLVLADLDEFVQKTKQSIEAGTFRGMMMSFAELDPDNPDEHRSNIVHHWRQGFRHSCETMVRDAVAMWEEQNGKLDGTNELIAKIISRGGTLQ